MDGAMVVSGRLKWRCSGTFEEGVVEGGKTL
jgi:hypothetical protein